MSNDDDLPVEEWLRRELRRGLEEAILQDVAGPALYGTGNFEVYRDDRDEPQLRPVAGWKPAELRGLINDSGSDERMAP